MESKPYGTVLIKAAKMLDFLSDNPQSTLKSIAEGAKMTASTTSKILDTLILIGYVKKDRQRKEFSLGSKFIRYGNKKIEQIDLVESARPYLEALQAKIDETIHLGILTENRILYVDKLEPKNQTIFMSSKIGITRPLYSSAMGKVALSELSEAEVALYIEQTEFQAFTENTITNPLRLLKELEVVKETQIAFDDEEMENDIFCFGVTLKRGTELVGTMSVSMPKFRLTDEKRSRIIEELLFAKSEIEKKL